MTTKTKRKSNLVLLLTEVIFISQVVLNSYLAAVALELHPRDPEVHQGVGDLYLEAGKKKEAENYYRKAIHLGLKFSEVKHILEKLEKNNK